MAKKSEGPVKKRLLILDDDVRLAKSLAREFEERGYKPDLATKISEIADIAYDFALVDLRLNGEFGLDAIKKLTMKSARCQIVVLSGYGSIATALEAIRLGAKDYLTKPTSADIIEAAFTGNRSSPHRDLRTPSLSQVEHEYIDFVLTRNKGNISKTAKDLGLHRQSLQRKLKKYT